MTHTNTHELDTRTSYIHTRVKSKVGSDFHEFRNFTNFRVMIIIIAGLSLSLFLLDHSFMHMHTHNTHTTHTHTTHKHTHTQHTHTQHTQHTHTHTPHTHTHNTHTQHTQHTHTHTHHTHTHTQHTHTHTTHTHTHTTHTLSFSVQFFKNVLFEYMMGRQTKVQVQHDFTC